MRYPPGSKHTKLTMLDVHRWLSERDVTIRVLSKQKERTLSGEGDGGLVKTNRSDADLLRAFEDHSSSHGNVSHWHRQCHHWMRCQDLDLDKLELHP